MKIQSYARPRRKGTYPSDLTDAEWEILKPLVPPAKPGGHPRYVDIREIINGILYVDRTGCQWDALPRDFPPRGTVYWYFRQWRISGDWQRMHDTLRRQVREAAGRQEEPSALILDSQSVKTDEIGGPRGRSDSMPARRSKDVNATSSSTLSD